MRVVVAGSRHNENGGAVFSALNKIHASTPITAVIEGGQRKKDGRGMIVGGVDFWAFCWAKQRGIPVTTVPAEWDDLSEPRVIGYRHGKEINLLAGPRRNRAMCREYGAAAAIIFKGGKGTENCRQNAISAGLQIIEVDV